MKSNALKIIDADNLYHPIHMQVDEKYMSIRFDDGKFTLETNCSQDEVDKGTILFFEVIAGYLQEGGWRPQEEDRINNNE